VALACLIAIPLALNHLPSFIGRVFDIARWRVLLFCVAAALTFTYRYGPCRREALWRWITWAAHSPLSRGAASARFSWYAASFGSFNKTYGSLGPVIGLMTWMWLSVIAILVGAKLNAETEHQTAREDTVGEPKPLGRRGAKIADTVGPPDRRRDAYCANPLGCLNGGGPLRQCLSPPGDGANVAMTRLSVPVNSGTVGKWRWDAMTPSPHSSANRLCGSTP
jgi:hypothetical protein